MIMLSPKTIKAFLKRQNLKPDDLSKLANIHRWSLRRFLGRDGAGLTHVTAIKLMIIMEMLDNRK